MLLYIENLSTRVNEHQLRSLFTAFGQVTSTRIILNASTGVPKGYALIEMPDAAAAEKAIQQLHGTDLLGKTLQVMEARPRLEGTVQEGTFKSQNGGYIRQF